MRRTVTATEVSKITGINYRTVVQHIKKGLLPAIRGKEHSHWRIDVDDMAAYAYQIWDAGQGHRMFNPYECLDLRISIYLSDF